MNGNEIDYLLLIVGILLSLFGWTLYWTGIRTLGLFFGVVIGLIAAGIIIIFVPLEIVAKYEKWIIIIFCIIGGLVGVFILKELNNIIFFAIGFFIGITIWQSIANAISSLHYESFSSIQKYHIADIVVGVIMGFITVKLQGKVMILITSFIGAVLICISLFNTKYLTQTIWIFPIFLVSVFVQEGWHRLITGRKRNQ